MSSGEIDAAVSNMKTTWILKDYGMAVAELNPSQMAVKGNLFAEAGPRGGAWHMRPCFESFNLNSEKESNYGD
jgi:hypothetical protein